MKAIPQLLSCLLVTSVAMLNSGAVWSDTPAKTSQAQSPSQTKVKRARQARAQTKHVVKPKVAAATVEPSQAKAKAPEQVDTAATPATSATVNPYLKPAVLATKASVENPYLPAPLSPAANLTLSKSLATAPAVTTTVVPPAPAIADTVTPVVAKAIVATPAASPVAVVTSPAQPVAVEAASAQAWAKIVAGPAAVPVTKAYLPAPAPVANPYLAYRTGFTQVASPQVAASVSPAVDPIKLFSSLRDFLPEPHLPSADIDILPSITKVYPTGERPMYVLTFKCPTELVGITPPPTKALRWLITSGMDAINSTNLLPFSMQQVCQ